MGIIVQKYGGSSVADADKIKNVARRVIRRKDEGNQLVVVVSAMGKTTDRLIELAQQVSDSPEDREMDVLLSTGETVSSTLLVMALHAMGHDAIKIGRAHV
jgi:aspartate kinase